MGSDGRPYTMSNRPFSRRSGHSVWVHLHLFLRSFPIQTHNVTVSLSNSFCFHWLHISQGNTIFHSTKQSPVCSGQPYAYYGVQYWHTSPIIHKKGVDRGEARRAARSITLCGGKMDLSDHIQRKSSIKNIYSQNTCIDRILKLWISCNDVQTVVLA